MSPSVSLLLSKEALKLLHRSTYRPFTTAHQPAYRPLLTNKAVAIMTAPLKAPIPVITLIAAPPIAALCKKVNGVPAATNPNDECHLVAILPATGPSAPKPTTSRNAGIAKVSPRIVMPLMTPNARYGWARIQAEMSFRRLRSAGLRRLTAQSQYHES